jgi:hypothetical protein
MATANDLDLFTRAYVVCALWSSTDLDGTPLDRDFNIEDISDETIQEMIADCAKFQADHTGDISGYPEQAGYDFWLTRNRHGAGFWDTGRPWADGAGDRLTEAAHTFGETDLYVGDDRKLYI